MVLNSTAPSFRPSALNTSSGRSAHLQLGWKAKLLMPSKLSCTMHSLFHLVLSCPGTSNYASGPVGLLNSTRHSSGAGEARLRQEIEFEEGISVINQIAETFRREAVKRMRKLAQRRNAVIPLIHRLPNEMLAEALCFSVCVTDDTPHHLASRGQISSRRDLQLVAHRWRDAVRHTPRFWSLIQTRYGPPAVQAYLQRSKNAPLDIFATVSYGFFRTNIEPHLHRCRFLSLHILPSANTGLLQLPTPRLKQAVLCSPLLRYIASPHLLKEAPRLFKLDLRDVVIPPGATVFNTLTDLRISLLQRAVEHRDPMKTSEDVLSLLGGCRRLTTLYLHLPNLAMTHPNTTNQLKTQLPHLKGLSLNVAPAIVVRLFNYIEAPMCSRIRLHGVLYGTFESAVRTELYRSLLNSFESKVNLYIYEEPGDRNFLELDKDTRTMELHVPSGRARTGASRVANCLRSTNPRILLSCVGVGFTFDSAESLGQEG